jgi:CheY-like chemotaxis protein/anti-sigma regulatory factor (Ser/Thr protein kinase)
VAVAGPSVILSPEKAQTMALALHELATNAAKYGALTNENGEVTVRWEIANGRLTLRWTESKGPAVTPPSRRGFGMKIITASIAQQSGGEVSFDWRPDGLACILSLAYGGADTAQTASRAVPEHLKLVTPRPKSPRIFLVEDEALVGMLVREYLEELGCTVEGPVSDLNEAVKAAKAGEFDAAVLDLNLGGVSAYPLADLLQANAIPFMFVTGYARDGIDERFSTAPILRKPIERDALETALRTALASATRPMSLRLRQ